MLRGTFAPRAATSRTSCALASDVVETRTAAATIMKAPSFEGFNIARSGFHRRASQRGLQPRNDRFQDLHPREFLVVAGHQRPRRDLGAAPRHHFVHGRY